MRGIHLTRVDRVYQLTNEVINYWFCISIIYSMLLKMCDITFFSSAWASRRMGFIIFPLQSCSQKYHKVVYLNCRKPKWSDDETVCARAVTNEVHCYHDADFSMFLKLTVFVARASCSCYTVDK